VLFRPALTPRRRLAYALGSPGFVISDRIVVAIAFYYYLPPTGRGLEPLLSQELFLGVLTAWGLSRLIGGAFDSLADPLVGWGSDRSHSRLGRRRSYMIYGVVPMVAAPVALFWPPSASAGLANFASLTALLVVYYVAFTFYVGPYLALIPELARTAQDRVDLTAIQAAVTLPILILFPAFWLAGVEVGRGLGLDTAASIRAIVVIASAASLGLCLLPILAVDEVRYAKPAPSALSLAVAVRITLRNRPFLLYLSAQILFILGVTMLQPAIPYFAVVLLGRGEGFAAALALASAPFALAGFFLVRALSTRFGPRRSIIVCIGLLALSCVALGAIRPDGPGGPRDLPNLALAFTSMGLSGFALAGFLVLPHVLMGQVIDLDERTTGANRSAMFYGVQGLLTKWVYAASLALLSFLFARFGNSPEEPLGVMLVGPVAAGLCALSMGLFALYPERRLLAEARRWF